MISTLYRGSVKNLVGPTQVGHIPSLIFEFTDTYSVFDWGKMPDLLAHKAEALTILASEIFERLEKPETWKEFSRTAGALALRKFNRFGSAFNEIGEELQAEGLRTHYLGVLDALSLKQEVEPKRISECKETVRRMVVRQVSVIKPTLTQLMGRTISDYEPTRRAAVPRLIPLEVAFRFGIPPGQVDFPVLELFTKLEHTDRPVDLAEALAISGVTAKQLQEMLLKSAWVAGALKAWSGRLGFDLADGKLEWALGEDGKVFLVDAIGLDELNLLREGVSFSKEFLQGYYQNSSWHEKIQKAKELSLAQAKSTAKTQGAADWKRFVPEGPKGLPVRDRELASQVYISFVNAFTGKNWFPDAWSLDKVFKELKELPKGHKKEV